MVALALAAAVAAAAVDDGAGVGAGVVTPHTWPASYKVGNAPRGHPGVRLQGPESVTVYTRAMRKVYNARQAPIPLPPDLVQRFRGKVIGACACAASKCLLERPPPIVRSTH